MDTKQKAIEIVASYGYHCGDAIDYDFAIEMVEEALKYGKENEDFGGYWN